MDLISGEGKLVHWLSCCYRGRGAAFSKAQPMTRGVSTPMTAYRVVALSVRSLKVIVYMIGWRDSFPLSRHITHDLFHGRAGNVDVGKAHLRYMKAGWCTHQTLFCVLCSLNSLFS